VLRLSCICYLLGFADALRYGAPLNMVSNRAVARTGTWIQGGASNETIL
jgi:hypothetical protein